MVSGDARRNNHKREAPPPRETLKQQGHTWKYSITSVVSLNLFSFATRSCSRTFGEGDSLDNAPRVGSFVRCFLLATSCQVGAIRARPSARLADCLAAAAEVRTIRIS